MSLTASTPQARAMLKFPLIAKSGRQSIQLPPFAKLRHVDVQLGAPTIWAECVLPSQDGWRAGDPAEIRTFEIYATGQILPCTAQWIGTYLDGRYVWHVFELPA